MINISVIIPTYNREDFLKKAIDSVLAQTYKDFELIIIDDGSTDKTKQLVDSYEQGIRYVYQDNKGPSGARNKGIRESNAEFIVFLDSDDWFDKEKLGCQFRAMQEKPDYLISHTEEIWYQSGNLLNHKNKHKKFGGLIFDKCLSICSVGMSTVMIKKEFFDKVGVFDEHMPCCEDYDLWLRASVKLPFLFIDKPLTLKKGGRPDQVSSIFARGMDKFRIYSLKKLIESGCLNSEQYVLALGELEKKCQIYGKGCIKHGKDDEGKFYLRLVELLSTK